MLKIFLPELLHPLTEICNHSLETSSFPTSWKRALINPTLKMKSPNSPADTRPIGLLPELSKVLERAVFSQLSTFLETNKLLSPDQHGFHPGHSTQTALLHVIDDIRSAVDNYKVTILILIDFSRAFDSISHPLLLGKLRALNMSDAE